MNQIAFDTFWTWINERHRIYLKKEAGEPKPWTEDKYLQSWRFCNVFRILDKQSQWLCEHVIFPHACENLELLLFNLFVFRAFNWHETYEQIGGWQDNWDAETVKDNLYVYLSEGNRQLISGAYMIRGAEGKGKWQSITEALVKVWDNRNILLEEINSEPTLQNAHKKILEHKFFGWGGFTAYQVVLDLTYTPILDKAADINTWCEFGPGAKNGMRHIYPDMNEKDMLSAARGLLLDSPKFLEPHVPPLTLQDIEFSLCELSKMMRLKYGGRGKERYDGV